MGGSLTLILTLTILATVTLANYNGSGDSGVRVTIPGSAAGRTHTLLLLRRGNIVGLESNTNVATAGGSVIRGPRGIRVMRTRTTRVPGMLGSISCTMVGSGCTVGTNLGPMSSSLLVRNSSSTCNGVLMAGRKGRGSPGVLTLTTTLGDGRITGFVDSGCGNSIVDIIRGPNSKCSPGISCSTLGSAAVAITTSPAPRTRVLRITGRVLTRGNVTLGVRACGSCMIPGAIIRSNAVSTGCFRRAPCLSGFGRRGNARLISINTVRIRPVTLCNNGRAGLSALNIGNGWWNGEKGCP